MWFQIRRRVTCIVKNVWKGWDTERSCAPYYSIYPMKMIIQMTKSCKDKSTQREVLEVINLIDKNEYELV